MPDATPGKLIIEGDWKKREDAPEVKPSPTAKTDAPAGQGGISVDADWKNQAAAERDRLAAQESKKPAGKGAAGQQELPPADFQTLLSTLVSQTLLYMGAFPDPQTGKAVVSLEYAKFHIDLIGVLEEKTKNNLTPQEAEDVGQVLNELRLRYVELTQAVSRAVQEGKLRPGSLGGPGAGVLPASAPRAF
ncbi:hypothetical protein BH11PLA1_BH11PLA1_04550 [soil metagenome]